MRKLSQENEFCMQFHFHANQSHFHKNGFALRLTLKKTHKESLKWPIVIGKTFDNICIEVLSKFGQQQLVMVNYVCGFKRIRNKEKYFE